MNKTIWVIDPLHSEVLFKIKHLVISTVTGTFRKFDGKVVTSGEGFENASMHLSIDVKSIDTNQSQRDEHLRSGEFFAADMYPQITFESTSFVKTGSKDYKLTGELTMKGATRTVVLDVEYGGSENNGHGVIKHGFEVSGTINRADFGMTWNKLTDTGGLGLGEEIKIVSNIQVSELVEEAV